MSLKNVQYTYAEDLSQEEKKEWGINIPSGLVALETTASKLERKPKILKKGILEYLWSLEKE